DDKNTHCAVFPSNGHMQFIWMVNHSHGTATLELDGPGQYWYGSTTGNDEGRGLTGSIVVSGDTPPEAKLDRPPQPQPEKGASMATYVEAGHASDFTNLSDTVGK